MASADVAYQPLHWRRRCWAIVGKGKHRHGCTHWRRPGYLTCALHSGVEADARRVYLTTSAPEREGVDRARVDLVGPV